MIFRIYHTTLGGHVHMRVFAGKAEGGLGKCGDLTMRTDEFEAFQNCSLIEFRPETVETYPVVPTREGKPTI